MPGERVFVLSASDDGARPGTLSTPPVGRSLGHRAPLLWLALPYLAGLVAGRIMPISHPALLLGPALGATLASLAAAWRRPRLWAPPLLLALFLAGDASYCLGAAVTAGRDGLPEREARLVLRLDRVMLTETARTALSPSSPVRPAGAARLRKQASRRPVAASPPRRRQTRIRRRLAGVATIVRADDLPGVPAGAKIYVSVDLRPGQAAPGRTAVIEAVGLLAGVPRRPPAGSFDARLADLGVSWRLLRGRLLRVQSPGNGYARLCERLAGRMTLILRAGLERRPDVAAIYRAMMLGQKQELQADQRLLFLHSGTMHLFAINGLHIGVVALSLHALLALLRCPRAAAAAVILGVLWLDVDTTGASPSSVRAFLMVAVLEAAPLFSLPSNSIAALAAAALAVVLFRPRDIFGASFQMSYGVVAAIVTLGLPLAARFAARRVFHPAVPEGALTLRQKLGAGLRRHLLGALGVGLAAALPGAVAGIQYFGLFAPGGIAANLALAPLAALVIVAGFLSICAGLAGGLAASRFLNGAASLLLRAIVWIIRQGLRAPGVCFAAHFRCEWIGPAALVVLLAACLAGYAGRWSHSRGGFWPPFLVVALALVFGVKFSLTSSP